MIAIEIDGAFLHLGDTKVRLKLRSPVFNRDFVPLGYSFPFRVPYNAHNARLLRHYERIASTRRFEPINCRIHMGGNFWRVAELHYTGYADSHYDADLRVPEDAVLQLLRNMSLRDLPQTYTFRNNTLSDMSVQDVNDELDDRTGTSLDTDFIYAPVMNRNPFGARDNKFLNLPQDAWLSEPLEYLNYYDEDLTYPWLKYVDNSAVEIWYRKASPYPYLHKVLEYLMAQVGRRLDGDVMRDPEVQRMVVVHNLHQLINVLTQGSTTFLDFYPVGNAIRLGQMLPPLTAIEFLVRLQRRFNAVLLFRDDRAIFRSLKDILASGAYTDITEVVVRDDQMRPEHRENLALTETVEALDAFRKDQKQDWTEADIVATVMLPSDLAALPASEGVLARVRVQNAIYRFTFDPNTNTSAWSFLADEHLPFEDGPDAKGLDVGVALTSMYWGPDAHKSRGWLVPRLDIPLFDDQPAVVVGGVRQYYMDVHQLGLEQAQQLRLLFYRGFQGDSTDGDYPLLTNDVYDYSGAAILNASQREVIGGEGGIYDVWYKDWQQVMREGRTIRRRARLPMHLVRNWAWDRKVMVDGNLYLVQEMDVEITPTGLGLAQLMMVQVPRGGGGSFTCAGPGYFSVYYEDAAFLQLNTGAGYFATRNAAGEVDIHPSGSYLSPPNGTYCVWPCDERGNRKGTVDSFVLVGATAGTVDLQGFADYGPTESIQLDGMSYVGNVTLPHTPGLTTFVLTGQGLTGVDISACPTLTAVGIQGLDISIITLPANHIISNMVIASNSLSSLDVDAIINSMDHTIPNGTLSILGTSGARTMASDTKMAQLASAGWTLLVPE